VSIYASTFSLEDEAEDGLGAPIIYQGSHILPANSDRRDGRLDLAAIPGHIDRPDRPALHDGRESDEPYHPWLRVSLDSKRGSDFVQSDAVLDRGQVEALRDYLTGWLESAPSSFVTALAEQQRDNGSEVK
jgi:hypothetical protein